MIYIYQKKQKTNQMKTIVATATTEQEANDIWLAIIAEQPHIEFADINCLQVTVVYTPVAEIEAQFAEIEAQREQADKKFWERQTQSEANSTKKRKQIIVKDLNAKVEKLCLFHLCVDKNEGIYQIRNNYGKNEVLHTCKTAIGVSRKLTRIYWDKQIARLIADGVIAS